MKKVLFSFFLTVCLLSGCKQQKEVIDLPRGTATAEMETAVDSFVEATKTRPVAPDSIQLHSIMIVKNGEVLLERWFNGESAEKPHLMHSVSKTFTATAGVASVDDVAYDLIGAFDEKIREGADPVTLLEKSEERADIASDVAYRYDIPWNDSQETIDDISELQKAGLLWS